MPLSRRARYVALSVLVGLTVINVVLAARFLRLTTNGSAATARSAPPAATDVVRIIGQERAAGGDATLTVSVPGAPRAAVLPAAAFEVSLDGRSTATTVDPDPAAEETVAIVADTSADAIRSDLQAAGNGLTELLLQLPTDSRAAVVGTAGPTLLQPITKDVTAALRALERVSPAGTASPGAALLIAARQVASAPRLHRAVLVVGSAGIAQRENEIADATLGAQTSGTQVYLVGRGVPGSSALRAALAATGGTAYSVLADAPLGPYDALAADMANRYRLTFPMPMSRTAVTVRVNATGVNGTAGSIVDPLLQ
jgi:hypothetical protein